jgi:magnesium chelatase subunit I
MDGVCKDCATRYGHGDPLTTADKVRIFELPLNARLEDVVGGINERLALEQQKVRLERGLLGHADGHIVYIDEVNLLEDSITDAMLDAAAQGHYTVRRGPMKLTYNARIMLIGSMNPEEGWLRPQLMDRFGLRAIVRGLDDADLRYQAYERATAYRRQPDLFAAGYAEATLALAEEIQQSRDRLPQVTLTDESRQLGLELVTALRVDSGRAEITLFEAARAHAAADERTAVTPADIRAVAMLALRQRQSPALDKFFADQTAEDARLTAVWQDKAQT